MCKFRWIQALFCGTKIYVNLREFTFALVIQDVACVCRSYPEIKRKQNNTILTRSATDRDFERHYLRPILRYHYSSNPIFFYWIITFKLLLNQSKLLINCLARGSSIQTRLISLKVGTCLSTRSWRTVIQFKNHVSMSHKGLTRN